MSVCVCVCVCTLNRHIFNSFLLFDHPEIRCECFYIKSISGITNQILSPELLSAAFPFFLSPLFLLLLLLLLPYSQFSPTHHPHDWPFIIFFSPLFIITNTAVSLFILYLFSFYLISLTCPSYLTPSLSLYLFICPPLSRLFPFFSFRQQL